MRPSTWSSQDSTWRSASVHSKTRAWSRASWPPTDGSCAHRPSTFASTVPPKHPPISNNTNVSSWRVWQDLRAGRLQVVLPNYPIADTGIYAVTPHRRLMPPRVRIFIEFLARFFGVCFLWVLFFLGFLV